MEQSNMYSGVHFELLSLLTACNFSALLPSSILRCEFNWEYECFWIMRKEGREEVLWAVNQVTFECNLKVGPVTFTESLLNLTCWKLLAVDVRIRVAWPRISTTESSGSSSREDLKAWLIKAETLVTPATTVFQDKNCQKKGPRERSRRGTEANSQFKPRLNPLPRKTPQYQD